ncbi:condensin complex subunit 2 [Carica papaya]|uniref:condensin complex subunit 2 n=1 Tax=Carica papaya TaxID=3649 RepID=UPI000B8CD3F2|nr:condensin complex subunit 2 [Carica papaya]
MAEALSPNPKQKMVTMAPRIQSPISSFFLGSNDDKLERAQARAARAAAIRRKSLAFAHAPPPQDVDPCLGKEQILELFHNCIKLASENKINQKNTWELGLIDHLCEIIKVEEENDVETNFQKASCTLEAGVKIYSLRVDSTHSEAYKVLGGINRVGEENGQDTTVAEDKNGSVEDEGQSKKEAEKKISPLSTLESSFEALNVKKFDVAFAVDPLYHQTSAQFDEGGARGLLLNNLGIYGDCQVLFDSQEIPGKANSCAHQHNKSEIIDLSFSKEYVDQMVLNVQMKEEISPSLRNIVNQFDEDNRRLSDIFSLVQKSVDNIDGAYDNENDYDDGASENCGTYAFDHDDQPNIIEENHTVEPTFASYNEEMEQFSSHSPNVDDKFEEVDEYLFLSLGFSKQNAWAGPDHWQYRKAKSSEDHPVTENESTVPTKKTKNKKQVGPDIDFTKALAEEMPDIFAPPKNPKSLLMPANRAFSNTKLPEDCHYQPENLVRLFLLPNVMCLGRRRTKSSDGLKPQWDDTEAFSTCGDDNVLNCQFDDGNSYSDVEDSNTLVSQPRQVKKIDVQFDKTSKQVDVQALKVTLWNHLQESPQLVKINMWMNQLRG